MTCLNFVGEVDNLGGGNLGKSRGGMWLQGANQLVLWLFYNETPIQRHVILHVTTLKS